jgi:hypothetical protein
MVPKEFASWHVLGLDTVGFWVIDRELLFTQADGASAVIFPHHCFIHKTPQLLRGTPRSTLSLGAHAHFHTTTDSFIMARPYIALGVSVSSFRPRATFLVPLMQTLNYILLPFLPAYFSGESDDAHQNAVIDHFPEANDMSFQSDARAAVPHTYMFSATSLLPDAAVFEIPGIHQYFATNNHTPPTQPICAKVVEMEADHSVGMFIDGEDGAENVVCEGRDCPAGQSDSEGPDLGLLDGSDGDNDEDDEDPIKLSEFRSWGDNGRFGAHLEQYLKEGEGKQVWYR